MCKLSKVGFLTCQREAETGNKDTFCSLSLSVHVHSENENWVQTVFHTFAQLLILSTKKERLSNINLNMDSLASVL